MSCATAWGLHLSKASCARLPSTWTRAALSAEGGQLNASIPKRPRPGTEALLVRLEMRTLGGRLPCWYVSWMKRTTSLDLMPQPSTGRNKSTAVAEQGASTRLSGWLSNMPAKHTLKALPPDNNVHALAPLALQLSAHQHDRKSVTHQKPRVTSSETAPKTGAALPDIKPASPKVPDAKARQRNPDPKPLPVSSSGANPVKYRMLR
mmetsp:Transcript_19792/g.50259  ORF Transcript_19792/g.50259 Transcript_19792/m.50259 type:complete len:206 (+) Transcript_19792:922-1539(+)